MKRKSGWLIIVIVMISNGMVYGQKNASHLPDSLFYFDHVNLDGVTVSGEKRIQTIRETPASMTALSSMKMEQNRVLSLAQITGLIPNLFMPDYGSRLTSPIYIRGIGSRINTPSIGLYVDGIAHFEKAGFNFDFLNVKQIEVLRGPQGTLYGRNTMGGIIHVLTHDPASSRKTFLGGEYAGYGTASIRFSHDQPIVKDELGLQLAGQYRQRNGFFINDFNDTRIDRQRSGSARIKLNYSPADRFAVQLTGSFERSREGGYPYGILQLTDSTQTAPVIGYDHPSSYARDMLGTGLRMSYSWAGAELVATSGYQYIDDLQDIDQDFTPRNLLVVTQDQQQHLLSQEVILRSTGSKRLEWVTGGYGFFQLMDRTVDVGYKADAVPVFRLPGELNKVKDYVYTNRGAAVFGQLRVKDVLTEGLDFIVGARLDQETDSLDYLHTMVMGENTIPQEAFEKGFDFLEFLPKAALYYSVSDQVSTYFSLSKGYKSGGFNSTFERPEDESFGSEYSWNYEWGVKTGSANKRYVANLALFYIDWTNQQIYQPVPSGQGSMLVNAGKSRSLGFELEALVRPMENLTANLSVGYTDARFTDYVRDEAKGISYSGNRIPYVPGFTWYGGATYRLPVYRSFVDEIHLNVNMTGVGRIYWDDQNTLDQDPYALLNARVDYQIRDFTLGLWARNLLNKEYLAFQFTALGNHYAQPGNPRLLGVSFSMRF